MPKKDQSKTAEAIIKKMEPGKMYSTGQLAKLVNCTPRHVINVMQAYGGKEHLGSTLTDAGWIWVRNVKQEGGYE